MSPCSTTPACNATIYCYEIRVSLQLSGTHALLMKLYTAVQACHSLWRQWRQTFGPWWIGHLCRWLVEATAIQASFIPFHAGNWKSHNCYFCMQHNVDYLLDYLLYHKQTWLGSILLFATLSVGYHYQMDHQALDALFVHITHEGAGSHRAILLHALQHLKRSPTVWIWIW